MVSEQAPETLDQGEDTCPVLREDPVPGRGWRATEWGDASATSLF